MYINEISYAINFSGSKSGAPCIFVNIGTVEDKCNKKMTVSQIKTEILQFPCDLVSFVGEEPLSSEKELVKLITQLKDRNKVVIVETNNSINPCHELRRLVDTFIVNLKCPSSGLSWTHNEYWNCSRWRDQDEIKFTLSTNEDVQFASELIYNKIDFFRGNIYLVPVMPKMSIEKISEVAKDYGCDKRIKIQFKTNEILASIKKGRKNGKSKK